MRRSSYRLLPGYKSCSRHIVQELQKDNQAAAQRNKLLESENRLLVSETDQLRQVLVYLFHINLLWFNSISSQELQLLEDNVEQSLLRQEEALNLNDNMFSSPSSGDVISLNKALKDQKVKFEVRLRPFECGWLPHTYYTGRWTSSNYASAWQRQKWSLPARHMMYVPIYIYWSNTNQRRVQYSKEISELEALVESKVRIPDEFSCDLILTFASVDLPRSKCYDSDSRHKSWHLCRMNWRKSLNVRRRS